jgi:CRP-like cAMP-binding protein
MSADDSALFTPMLETVELPLRKQIEAANQPIRHVYFPQSGIVSVVAKNGAGREIEAGMIGREGMTGMAVLLGNHQFPNESYAQGAGSGFRIGVEDLHSAMIASETLRNLFFRFTQIFMIQVAQTAIANGRGKLEERLARWLLMADDRLGPEDLSLTHEFLALMLGVRRPGVTDALHELEGKGLVRSVRMNIRIIDRAGLEELAAGNYGAPEAEYKRLIG